MRTAMRPHHSVFSEISENIWLIGVSSSAVRAALFGIQHAALEIIFPNSNT
jgi:hypothetical protein